MEFSTKFSKNVPSKEKLIESMEKRHLYCIASREEDDEVYCYFYCQEEKSKSLLLFDLLISAEGNLEVTVKGEKTELLGQMQEYLKKETQRY